MAEVNVILPADAERAKVYGSKNPTEIKTLLSDGSVIEGIPVIITGSTSGGGVD